MPLYAVNLLARRIALKKWVARLWNVSEERGMERPIQSHHHALQCSFRAFPGRATQNMQLNKVNGSGCHWPWPVLGQSPGPEAKNDSTTWVMGSVVVDKDSGCHSTPLTFWLAE